MTRVLLVEDSKDVLGVLQLELEWMGYQVDAVSDGDTALDAARRTSPDVIVSDLCMPGMNGLELILRLRKIPGLASIPAIALTGTSEDKDIQDAFSAGFAAHLVKPVEPKELGDEITRLVATTGSGYPRAGTCAKVSK
jgi:two-component system CheB/CheR fusion protein